MSYIGTAPSKTTPNYKIVSEFTATAGQTVFAPSAYTIGFIDVFRNGVKLGAPDFTATNGTTVTLANACTAGDFVRFESVYLSPTQNAIPNTAGAVSTSLLADASVTQVKLGTNVAGNGPAFAAYATTNQSFTRDVNTKITFDTEEFDTSNSFSSSRFQPQVAGYYQINLLVRAASVGGTNMSALIYKTGSLIQYCGSNCDSNGYGTAMLSQVVYLNGTTDYIEGWGVINGSSGANFNSASYNPYGCRFSGCLVRAA